MFNNTVYNRSEVKSIDNSVVVHELELALTEANRYFMKKKSKAKIRNQYIQVPYLTRNTIWKGDKNAEESQELSFFPADDHKATGIREDSI